MLAKVALVDFRGNLLYSAFVAPTMQVVDYRTSTTGIQAAHLTNGSATPFATVQRAVADLLRGRIIIGHALWQDLSVLGLSHPAVSTRDVGLYLPFRNALRAPSHVFDLPTLVSSFMQRRIQVARIDPTENARAALDLYRSYAATWEASIASAQWPCALPPSSFSRCYL